VWSDTDAHVITDGILPTPGRAGSEPLTMSSREIAELLGARHDNVKRTVDRLGDRGTIGHPPLEDDPFVDAQGKPRVGKSTSSTSAPA
jgi:phage regulator Rha-like protein